MWRKQRLSSSWSRSWSKGMLPFRPGLRRRFLRRQHLQRDYGDRSKHGKRGLSAKLDQDELLQTSQSRRTLRLPPAYQREYPMGQKKGLQQNIHEDSECSKDPVCVKATEVPTQNRDGFGEKTLGELFSAEVNKTNNVSPHSKVNVLVIRVQKPFLIQQRPKIKRVRRRKSKANNKKDKELPSEIFPKSSVSKKVRRRKTKLHTGQDRPLLDVLFPRSLFSRNRYAKTRLNNYPE